jgi:hypothetical protein
VPPGAPHALARLMFRAVSSQLQVAISANSAALTPSRSLLKRLLLLGSSPRPTQYFAALTGPALTTWTSNTERASANAAFFAWLSVSRHQIISLALP